MNAQSELNAGVRKLSTPQEKLASTNMVFRRLSEPKKNYVSEDPYAHTEFNGLMLPAPEQPGKFY